MLGSIAIAIACTAATPKAAPPVPPLPDGLVQAASDAAAKGTLLQVTPKIEQELLAILAGGNVPQQPERVIPLEALREFTRYFGKLPKPSAGDIATLQWLLGKPKLLETLMLAVSEKDQPAKVLSILSLLRQDQQDHLEEYSDLTAAMCVVWDEPFTQAHALFRPITKPDPMKPRMLMRYYINARAELHGNPQQLPWPLVVYMVDNLADQDDIAWAMNRYAGRGKIGGVFFDVTYDYDMLGGTSEGRLADKEYTLQNILREGGICGDQAYFAAQVARSVGVPAVICTGVNANEGTGHAWVGYLSTRGAESAWDFDEGRYPENRYWKGNAIDPQTREHISDADISMLAELSRTQPRERMTSAALTKAADLVSPGIQPAVLMQAINLSPGNRRAWTRLAELAAQRQLTGKQLSEFTAVVNKFAVKEYPDFAFKLLKVANSGRGGAEQLKALEEMEHTFAMRPDLQADIYIALGDLYQSQKQPNEAFAAYDHVLDQYSNMPPVVVEALDHLDKMLREMKEMPLLSEVYGSIWKRMPQPDTSIAIKGTAFYRIGERYERLLIDLGDTNTAQNVRSRLESMTATLTAGKK